MINLDENQKIKQDNGLTKESMSFDDRQRLVGAFAWLIQEDKKQNPELYLKDCSKGLSNVQSK